ncbi:hypothetical protein [Sporolactobacillus putidus]|nr:hypothetical protein [Sporolactobacillus putidus]
MWQMIGGFITLAGVAAYFINPQRKPGFKKKNAFYQENIDEVGFS